MSSLRARVFFAASLLAACGDEEGVSPAPQDDSSSDGPTSGPTSTAPSASSTGTGDGGATGSSTPTGAGAGSTTGAGGDGHWSLAFDPLTLPDELNIVTEMRFLPGAPDELLVLEKDGRVSHLRIDGDEATRLGDFTVETYDEQDCGLISLAFAPDFASSGDLYLGLCESRFASRVDRVHFDPADYEGIPGTAENVLRLEEPAAQQPWHNVGAMGFEEGGVLWVLAGDKTVGDNAQDLGSDLGKLLRVVPHETGEGADPAPDNPFLDQEGASPFVYAYGLRSPWRGTRDRKGRYWIGDVGLDTWEEVNVALEPGTNFGWPDHEGPCGEDVGDGCTEPVTYYGRGETDPYVAADPDHFPAGTRAVWVGPFLDPVEGDPYEGELDDHLLFGDLHTGFVRMLHIGEGREVLADFPVAHLAHGMAWDRGPGGYLYVLTFGTLLATDTTPSELYRVRLE